MRKPWLWITICVALIIALSIPLIQSLEITDYKSGRTLALAPVHTGEQFVISFTHSIAKTPVEEVFVVGPGQELIVTETIYESFGAGLPFDTEGPNQQLITAGGKFRLTGLDRHLPEFLQAVGTVANHQLLINGKQIPFYQFAKPGQSVRIRVRKQSLMAYFLTNSFGLI